LTLELGVPESAYVPECSCPRTAAVPAVHVHPLRLPASNPGLASRFAAAYADGMTRKAVAAAAAVPTARAAASARRASLIEAPRDAHRSTSNRRVTLERQT
jgi:hypothetical protein